MSAHLATLDALLTRWASLEVRATTGRMNAAAHLMAERARTLTPRAAVLVLEDSDQGDWLTLVAVEDAAGRELDVDILDIDDGAASYIYSDAADTITGLEVRASSRAYANTYTITIGQTACQPMPVEVVVVRDPDGPDEVNVFVGGEPATDQVSVVRVDAGAGWTAEEWHTACQTALVGASPQAGLIITAAYNSPTALGGLHHVR